MTDRHGGLRAPPIPPIGGSGCPGGAGAPLGSRGRTPKPGPGHPERGKVAVEEFADGEIRSYRGRVDRWLLVVYAVLSVWGVYYLIVYWGGLGPGQAR